MYQLICVWCRTSFQATRPDARFHSARCCAAHWRAQREDRVLRTTELLAEVTTAIEAGSDPTVMIDIARRSRRLFEESAR